MVNLNYLEMFVYLLSFLKFMVRYFDLDVM